MGILNNGPFGPVSGRVGGLVGAHWKGQPYVRSYVVPGASRTTLQGAQRNRFLYTVAACKPYVGRVYNPYYDKFLSRRSGFNQAVATNIPKKPGFTPATVFQHTDGPLYPGSAIVATWNGGGSKYIVTWGAEHGVDGEDTDVAIAWGRNSVTNEVVFSTDTTRVAATVDVVIARGTAAVPVDIGLFFAKKSGSLVVKISRNLSTWKTDGA